MEIQKADYKLRLREGERTISCLAPESGGPPLNLLDFCPPRLCILEWGFFNPTNSQDPGYPALSGSAVPQHGSTRLDVDLLTIAGHKLYAPKGVGAAWMQGV